MNRKPILFTRPAVVTVILSQRLCVSLHDSTRGGYLAYLPVTAGSSYHKHLSTLAFMVLHYRYVHVHKMPHQYILKSGLFEY